MKQSILKGVSLALLLALLFATLITLWRPSPRVASAPLSHEVLALSPLTQKTLQIISYNVYMRPQTLWLFRDGQETRAGILPTKLKGADILVLQEVFDRRARRILFRGLAREYPHRTKMLGRPGWIKTHGGVYILSRWPIIQQTQHLYRQCAGTDCLATKGAVYARIQKPGLTFSLFATHTQAHASVKAQQARKSQFAALARMVRAQRIPAKEPVFIVGDLNVDRLHSKQEFAQMCKLLGAKLPALRGLPATLTPKQNPLASGESKYLDYVLYLPKHMPKATRAWQASVALRANTPWREGVLDLSDHYAVVGFFAFP